MTKVVLADMRFSEKDEKAPLLGEKRKSFSEKFNDSISVVFAVACIVDQFGVSPIVALPKGIIQCGWMGYALALFVFALTIYTAILLGRCWIIAEQLDESMALKNRYAYSALTEMAWGKNFGKVISILINISVLCNNIPALLIASQNLQFLDVKITDNKFNFSYCYWLIILGVSLCPLTWIGSPKDTKWISVFSAFFVLVCALLTWISMLQDRSKASDYHGDRFPTMQEMFITFGILTFQFGSHPSILTIQSDMQDKSKLSKSILFSFGVTGSLSLITTCLASVLYGSATHPNLTQGLPVNELLYFNILIVTLQLFLSTIVGQCALFQDVENKLGISRELCWQRCVVRTLIVAVVIVLAEVLPRFDLVMGIIGGLLTGPITLIVPPILYIRFRKLLNRENTQENLEKSQNNFQHRSESQRGPMTKLTAIKTVEEKLFQEKSSRKFGKKNVSVLESAIAFFVVSIGILQTMTVTYFSASEAIQSTRFLPPCIVDVREASRIINR